MNSVKLSNVAVVRLTRKGVRFEVACYPSKVLDFRNGVETDLDSVLQVEGIFKNVSNGILASSKELKILGASPLRKILEEGELQVSEKERTAQLDALFKDVAKIVAEKTLDTRTGLPFPVASIERAMRNLHFAPTPRSAKQQALEVIKKLQASDFGIQRAPMRLRYTGDKDLTTLDGVTVDGDTLLVEPRVYREALKLVDEGQLHIVEHNARPQRAVVVEDKVVPKAPTTTTTTKATTRPKLSCNTCQATFNDTQEHRSHFKSDWHRLNLRRKLDNQPPIPFDRHHDMIAVSGM